MNNANSKHENKQNIELELDNGSRLTFEVSRNHYISFIDETKPNKKFQAMQAFLTRTIIDSDREHLMPLLQNPVNVTDLCGEVIEEYRSDISVVAKKRKSALKSSKTTATTSS